MNVNHVQICFLDNSETLRHKKSAGNGILPVLRLEALALPIAVRTSNAETHAVYI